MAAVSKGIFSHLCRARDEARWAAREKPCLSNQPTNQPLALKLSRRQQYLCTIFFLKIWFSGPSLSARLIIKRKTSEHSILWVEMTFTELGLHWRDFQQPISTSASTPPRPRVSGRDAHPIDGISIRSAGTWRAHVRRSVNNKWIQKGGFRSGGHVKVHSLAVRGGYTKGKKVLVFKSTTVTTVKKCHERSPFTQKARSRSSSLILLSVYEKWQWRRVHTCFWRIMPE